MTFPLPSDKKDVYFCLFVGLSLCLFMGMLRNKKSFKKRTYSKKKSSNKRICISKDFEKINTDI